MREISGFELSVTYFADVICITVKQTEVTLIVKVESLPVRLAVYP